MYFLWIITIVLNLFSPAGYFSRHDERFRLFDRMISYTK